MAQARKTVSVEFVKAKVNYFMEHSGDDQADERKGAFDLADVILHETNNYRGFNYLPGVFDFSDSLNPVMVGDETRRFFY